MTAVSLSVTAHPQTSTTRLLFPGAMTEGHITICSRCNHSPMTSCSAGAQNTFRGMKSVTFVFCRMLCMK